ncbi:hypothetical protein PLESTM_002029900 [Pleodorina starrii]|nr:hypothetical protein PLESTM_002029900 [Pleodorina starrii]
MNGELDLPDEGSDVDPNDVAGGGVNGNPQDPDGEPDAEPVDDPVDIPLVEAALESYAPFFPTQVAVRSNSTGRRPTFRDVNIATNSRIIYTYNSLATNASSRRHGRPSYFMAPNAFVGSSIAEWYLGAAGSRPQNHSTLAVYSRVLTTSQLPASLDYRGTAADGPGVKDQLGCNGCWAFTAVGALQGAWAKATGTPLSFSEQQLLDCAWGNGNMGCSQGDPISALLYVVGGSRGIAEEGMYPYEGVGGFCRLTRSKPPLVGRFSRVVMLPAGDDAALMEALVRFGPLSVIMQVMPSFMFYSSGVYYDSSCNGTLGTGGQLYHSVVLMGYGTTADGVDYWIIKNRYGLVARAHNGTDCGINQYAAFVEVAPKAVAAAAAVGVGRRLLLG